MKRSEAIETYREEIAAAMRKAYRSVIECRGAIQYSIYVWEDGKIEELETAQGDNSFLAASTWEDWNLFDVTTVSMPCVDVWDLAGECPPDDEKAREEAEEAIIDWLCDEYRNDVDENIDRIIEDAEILEDIQSASF